MSAPYGGPRTGSCRRVAAWAIVLAVAAVHVLRAGSHLHGASFRFYYSYASDILLPLAAYFVLCLSEPRLPLLRDWRAKAALVSGVASTAEVLQGFGVPALGRTFDPLDLLMYAIGALLAVLLDKVLVGALCRHRAPTQLSGAPRADA